MSVVVQPFVDPDPREESVPIVDLGPTGPPRCGKCRGYVNPWCTWVAGGMRWKCNLCGYETEGRLGHSRLLFRTLHSSTLVSTEYFSNLDANMLRLDHAERTELNRGTVEFTVSEEYWARHPPAKINPSYFSVGTPPSGPKKPLPMNYIFAFDVSSDAIETGFVKTSCDALKTVLFGGNNFDGQHLDTCFPAGSQLTILTYDRTLHFYDLKVRVRVQHY